MDELEKFKNMSVEEANAYLEEAEKCTHDCSNCSSQCASKSAKIKFSKKVYAVISGKGGTGKSAVTVLLAKALKKAGVSVAILDADIVNASIPGMVGMYEPVVGDASVMAPVECSTGIPVLSMALISEKAEEPIIWSGIDLAKVAVYMFQEGKWPKCDILLVDMPSGAGDIPLEYFTTMPFDGSIAVLEPGEANKWAQRRAVNLAEMLMVPVIGIVENFCDDEIPLEKEFSDIPVVAEMKYDPALRKAANAGKLDSYDTDVLDFFARLLAEQVK